MTKITKAQTEVLKNIYEGCQVGKSYTISSYLDGKITVAINSTTTPSWNTWVTGFTLNKSTLKVLLEKGLLVALPQRNNFDDVSADYHNWTDFWKLSDQGMWLCEELFGKIAQPVVEVVAQPVIEAVQVVVTETVEVVEVAQATNETKENVTAKFDSLTDQDRKAIAVNLIRQWNESFNSYKEIGDSVEENNLAHGNHIEKGCNGLYPELVNVVGEPIGFRLAAECRWATIDDVNELRNIFEDFMSSSFGGCVGTIEPAQEVQPKVSQPSVTVTTTIEISKHEVLASLLTPQELYIIYALVGKARQTATGGSQTHQQLEKLTDKVMNALSVVHHQQGNLDGLRCLCHNQKLVGSKCPRETVKLAS